MDFDALRKQQHGNFASRQLAAAGWSEGRIRAARGGTREVHDGVHLTGDAPLTQRQRWWAATLTAEGTWLSDESAGALYDFADEVLEKTTVTRRGSGGVEDFGDLRVRRTLWLPPEDVGQVGGLPILSPGRTVLDLVARRNERAGRRLVRTALRVEAVTGPDLWNVLARHHGRRGAGRLRRYAKDYAHLPIEQTLSDPEAVALAVLDAAGVPIPLVNKSIEGESADLTWLKERRIVELDSRRFHHPVEDARKQAHWESRGWDVRRLPTQAVYDQPDRLIAQAPRRR